MSDPTATVIAVIDTVDAIQSRPIVQNPEDVSRRVRQVYQDQQVPLSETALTQAIAAHGSVPERCATPKKATDGPSPETVKRKGFSPPEVVLAVTVLANMIVCLAVTARFVDYQSDIKKVTPALILAAHQDATGATKAMSSDVVSAPLKKLDIPWAVSTDQGGHTAISLKHAPPFLGSTLVQSVLASNQSPLTVRVNGVLIRRQEDLNVVVSSCSGHTCDVPPLDILLTDGITPPR